MSTAGQERPYKGGFCVKSICIYCLQSIPSQVIVSISGRRIQAGLADFVFLHGMKYLHLVILCVFINFLKTAFQLFFNFVSIGQYLRTDSQFPVYRFHITHLQNSSFLTIFQYIF